METQIDSKLMVPGLIGEVGLWRDQWGIPHIRAGNQRDTFLALGFAHAEDRLWQMDMQRRRASGRWAEWAGPSAVEADKLARRMGGQRAAERDYAALGTEAREMLDAYAQGVNAFIALGRLPREYRLLEEVPEPWVPWNSIAVMRQIGFLMGSIWLKLFRAAALPSVGFEGISLLRYDDGGEDLLCIPPGAVRTRAAAALDELRPSIEALLNAHPPDLMGGGSNNWAISGNLTATGRPILMGDPHRELEVPTMYTQAHIACDTFDAIGLTVPGVPGFPHVAHNEKVAWCVTHAFMDIHDVYIEKFRSNGDEVLFRENWEKASRHNETIRVRGQADGQVEIVETRHGPVIAGNPADGIALSVRSAQFAVVDKSFDCLPKMLKSDSVIALYNSVADWGLIDHNLVAADVDGRIGHRVRAKVPRRSRENGWLPVPGWTGQHEWNGFIPHEEMPENINPAGGRIVTANNRVVEDGSGPYLCTDCHPPHRAQRISDFLDQLERPSIADMNTIYMDVQSSPALMFKARLEEHRGKTKHARDMLKQFALWDGKLEASSTMATTYSALRVAVTIVIARKSGLTSRRSDLTAGLVPSSGVISHLWWVVPALLRDGDTTLLGGSSWAGVLDEAFEFMESQPAESLWWEAHAPTLRHPLSAVFPDAAADLDMACTPVGGDNDTVFATGYSAGDGFATKYSALARTSFDVGAWENCTWTVFQGASGEIGNAHRSDQNQAWGSGGNIPMLYSWTEIEIGGTNVQLAPPRK